MPVDATFVANCLSVEAVAQLVEGKLGGVAFDAAERHIAECAACARLVADVGLAAHSHNSARHPPAHASRTDRPDRWLIGIDRYELLHLLGQGGMGIVFAAKDRVLGRTVALKLLHADVETEELEARMLCEATLLATLSHPEIVTVFDVGRDRGRLFLALELVVGGTIRTWISAAPRSYREIFDLYTRAGRGLQGAHEAGIVHRDFKPDNVLVGDDGRVRVTDFGLARSTNALESLEDTMPIRSEKSLPPSGVRTLSTGTGAIVGTPAYMAPEQLNGHESTEATDLFSFCVSMYEGLYGERPFGGETLAELRSNVLSGRTRPVPPGSRVPNAVRAVLLAGLRLHPHRRFSSMAALLRALARADRMHRALRVVMVGFSVCLAGSSSYEGAHAWQRHALAKAAANRAPPPCGTTAGQAVLYVDQASSREEVGTPNCPFRTIRAALAEARTVPDSEAELRVAPGRYSVKSGETFPLDLRGLSLIGAGAETTFLEGAAEFDHSSAGGILNRPGETPHLTILFGDERRTTSLAGFTVSAGEDQRPDLIGVACDRGAGAELVPPAAPNSTLRDLRFDNRYITAVMVGTSTRPHSSGCNLRLVGSTLPRASLWAAGCGTGEGIVPVSLEVGDNTEEGRNVFSGGEGAEADSTVRPLLAVWDCVAKVHVLRNTFEHGKVGIDITRHPEALPAEVVIDNNVFRRFAAGGVVAHLAANIDRLEGNTFSEIVRTLTADPPAPALWMDGRERMPPPSVRRARRNRFFGNDIGVLLRGAAIPQGERSHLYDFGTAEAEGANDFFCNSTIDGAPGFDVELAAGGLLRYATFAGNHWDHYPPTTSLATSAANGVDVVVLRETSRASRASRDPIDPSPHGVGGLKCPLGHEPGPTRE